MMDESSPLATLGEHIAKLSSLGKANGYGKCKDRLQQKYLCSWSRSRLYTLPYRSLPYIYFLRGRTGTDHLFPRRDTTYLPSSTSAPPASPWRSYYVSFFHSISISTWRHIKTKKKHLSDCPSAYKLPPESRYHHNLYESCRIRPCHFHISHISQFFLHACDGVCNSLSETISIFLS